MSYTGPYHRDANIYWPGQTVNQYRDYQDVYKTSHGFPRVPLPYRRTVTFYGRRTTWGVAENYGYEDCFQLADSNHPEGRMYLDSYGLVPKSSNRARSKFVNRLRQEQSASIGETLGDWRQTFTMMASRLKSLYTAYKAVKQGDIRRAAQALNAKPPPGWRNLVKKPADLWLEWHWGWVPLMQDIHDGCEILSEPLPVLQKIHVSSRAAYLQEILTVVDTGYVKYEMGGLFSCITRIGGYAKLVSPSVGLADQLGLINPVGVAWELVPFSFFVDRIVDIGGFIDSYTDTLGWELSEVSTSVWSLVQDGYLKRYAYTGSPGNYTYGAIYTDCFGSHMTRGLSSTGLPAWCLYLSNPFRDLSVARGATYVALLLQLL